MSKSQTLSPYHPEALHSPESFGISRGPRVPSLAISGEGSNQNLPKIAAQHFTPQQEPLSLLLGDFAYQALKELKLLKVAEAVFEGTLLSEKLGSQLLQTDLPALGRLVELQRQTSGASVRASAGNYPFSPLAFLPIAAAIESEGPEKAFEIALEQLLGAAAVVQPAPFVHFAIDRWHGQFSLPTLLNILRRLHEFEGLEQQSFIPIGPTAGELKTLAKSFGDAPFATVLIPEFFDSLRECGIQNIEGGLDLSIHSLALEADMPVIVGQDLSQSRLLRSPGETSSRFLQNILSLRTQLYASPYFFGWAPWSPAVLDQPTPRSEAPLGLELLSAIACARLLLPKTPVIRAPLGLLGSKVAQLALAFGANDLGYAAADETAAEHLGLILYQEIVEEFQSEEFLPDSVEEALCKVA